MFRHEPDAEFSFHEGSRPDPRHRGIRIIERTYFLDPGRGGERVKLSPAFGEAIAAGRAHRPEPMGRAGNRYWWVYGDRVYSTPDRLSRSAVMRMTAREHEPASQPPPRSSPALTDSQALVN